ncbi:MAG: hypothetical protein ACLFTH_03895 [Candidatus Woesearchaeota archaeon]
MSSIHRLHLLPYFDRIYLFKKGRITDSGAYDTLNRRSPESKKMLDKYKQREFRLKR